MSSSQEFSQNTSADHSTLPTAPATPLDTGAIALEVERVRLTPSLLASVAKELNDIRVSQLTADLARANQLNGQLQAELQAARAAAAMHANAHTFIKEDDSMDDDDEPSQLNIYNTNIIVDMAVDNTSLSTFIVPPPPPPQDITMDRWIPLLNQIAQPEIHYKPSDVWTPVSVQNAIDHCEVLVFLMRSSKTELEADVLRKDATISEMRATIQQLRDELKAKEGEIGMQDSIIETLGGIPLYKWNTNGF